LATIRTLREDQKEDVNMNALIRILLFIGCISFGVSLLLYTRPNKEIQAKSAAAAKVEIKAQTEKVPEKTAVEIEGEGIRREIAEIRSRVKEVRDCGGDVYFFPFHDKEMYRKTRILFEDSHQNLEFMFDSRFTTAIIDGGMVGQLVFYRDKDKK
jgi:hypothetical protein